MQKIPIEPWTTVKEMDEMLIAKLRINNGLPFCTFEVSPFLPAIVVTSGDVAGQYRG